MENQLSSLVENRSYLGYTAVLNTDKVCVAKLISVLWFLRNQMLLGGFIVIKFLGCPVVCRIYSYTLSRVYGRVQGTQLYIVQGVRQRVRWLYDFQGVQQGVGQLYIVQGVVQLYIVQDVRQGVGQLYIFLCVESWKSSTTYYTSQEFSMMLANMYVGQLRFVHRYDSQELPTSNAQSVIQYPGLKEKLKVIC